MKLNLNQNRVGNPLGEFSVDVDHLFDHVFGNRRQAADVWRPPVSIEESETEYRMVMELPGVAVDAVSLEFQDNQLEISGTRAALEPAAGVQALRQERVFGDFRRAFGFAQPVDAERIEASCEDGLLKVTLPKSQAALPRKIQIRAGN